MTSTADNRADFIKRIFAVSVSVGFASQLSNWSWFTDGKLPDAAHFHDIVLLLVALGAVVASWEGYLAGIDRRPLVDLPRFCTDIVIVFSYLALMRSSTNKNLYVLMLIGIFALYGLWDYFGILAYRSLYGVRPGPLGLLTAVTLFVRPARDRQGRALDGPLITLVWGGFMLAIGVVNRVVWLDGFYPIVAAMVWGLALYRTDKVWHFAAGRRAALTVGPICLLLLLRAVA